ncbi:hypothetical protein RJT34_13505 [Clitoria ternatea]|uniref:Uncharacterized protein n=1 Tax=Clitoria ternatea TaxID=43366 RepID=A0AAN9PLS9_CLITE
MREISVIGDNFMPNCFLFIFERYWIRISFSNHCTLLPSSSSNTTSFWSSFFFGGRIIITYNNNIGYKALKLRWLDLGPSLLLVCLGYPNFQTLKRCVFYFCELLFQSVAPPAARGIIQRRVRVLVACDSSYTADSCFARPALEISRRRPAGISPEGRNFTF